MVNSLDRPSAVQRGWFFWDCCHATKSLLTSETLILPSWKEQVVGSCVQRFRYLHQWQRKALLTQDRHLQGGDSKRASHAGLSWKKAAILTSLSYSWEGKLVEHILVLRIEDSASEMFMRQDRNTLGLQWEWFNLKTAVCWFIFSGISQARISVWWTETDYGGSI